MIYSSDGTEFSGFIDTVKTAEFFPNHIDCETCGGRISRGDEYFEVRGVRMCLACADVADDMILSQVRGDYLYEL